MQVVISLVFDGLAYGMMLFVIAVGLSITMGLMGFVNLAHGAFAMIGGYLTVVGHEPRSACRSSPALGLAFAWSGRRASWSSGRSTPASTGPPSSIR